MTARRASRWRPNSLTGQVPIGIEIAIEHCTNRVATSPLIPTREWTLAFGYGRLSLNPYAASSSQSATRLPVGRLFGDFKQHPNSSLAGLARDRHSRLGF